MVRISGGRGFDKKAAVPLHPYSWEYLWLRDRAEIYSLFDLWYRSESLEAGNKDALYTRLVCGIHWREYRTTAEEMFARRAIGAVMDPTLKSRFVH